ncbi:MAG: ABC transporter ATP-binding protein [bacterium]|nr:ABC transporter ATP-binding protein [bacterium]MCP5044493.1 ABC transporter ATP-binding protein [bacterium]
MSEAACSAQPKTAQGAQVVARGLSRQFGDHHALRELDLTIEPGEAFGLLGANGAGKTTFIRLVTGFLVPSAGEILVDGHSPATEPRAVQQRLGFVSEVSHLYPELKVVPFLRFAGGIRGLTGKTLECAVEQTLERFDLASVKKRRIGNLSKGFQQRVSLAQALVHDPALVIADEPTSGLDPLQRRDVQRSLAELDGNRTLLLCTHDLEEARLLTTRCAILFEGTVVAAGPTDEILASDSQFDLFRGRTPERDRSATP